MKIGYKLKKKPHPESGGGREGWFQAVLFIHLVVLILCLQVHPTSWSRTFTEFVLTAYDLLCHCPNLYFLGEFCLFLLFIPRATAVLLILQTGSFLKKRRAKDRHFCFCKITGFVLLYDLGTPTFPPAKIWRNSRHKTKCTRPKRLAEKDQYKKFFFFNFEVRGRGGGSVLGL